MRQKGTRSSSKSKTPYTRSWCKRKRLTKLKKKIKRRLRRIEKIKQSKEKKQFLLAWASKKNKGQGLQKEKVQEERVQENQRRQLQEGGKTKSKEKEGSGQEMINKNKVGSMREKIKTTYYVINNFNQYMRPYISLWRPIKNGPSFNWVGKRGGTRGFQKLIKVSD